MAANPNWWNPAWQYRLDITIDHTMVNSDLTDFPLLVNITEAHLSNALTNGDDILLCKANNDDQLKHEIEYFDQLTGELVLWVKTDLSSSTDTIVYLYYGNVASGNQQDMHNTWRSEYKMIQHFQELTGNRIDSTINANDGVATAGAAVTGKIDGAISFSGAADGVNCGHGATLDITSALTVSAWVQNNYVPIYTLQDLQDMQNDLTKSYVLINDIDATATSGWNGGLGFIPVGTDLTPFRGNFEGNGFTISNLFINRPSEVNIGLFGFAEPVTGTDAKIENVTLSNVNITGDTKVGSLCGYNYKSNPTNCHSSGTVTAIGMTVGGLCGNVNKSTKINKCSTSCTVIAGGGCAGGFVGYIGGYRPGTVVNDCFATGSVDGGTGNAGGFAGEYYSRRTPSALISRCYSTGAVTGGGVLGGWAANSSYSGATADCFWDMQTSGQATSYCGATGKTTAEMKQQLTFTNHDFVDVWDITENVTYPWLRTIAVSGDVVLISKGRDAYSLEMNLAGETLKGFINNIEVNAAITPNALILVTMWYDGANLKLFVNGVEVNSIPLVGVITTNATDLMIGNVFVGTIDEVRISDIVQTDDWLKTSYDNQDLLAGFLTALQVDALYFDLKMIDHLAVAIETARVVVRDNVDVIVTEEDTTISGSISQQAYVNAKTAHAIQAYKYGKKMMPSVLDIDKDLDWTFTLYVDPYITETNETTVSGYSGITIDYGIEIITISENHTIEEIYDYCQYDIISNPQSDINQTMHTGNGADFTGEYDFIVNDGIAISAAGKKLTMVTGKTYNLNTSGQFTGIIADQTKTRVPIKLSGLVAGSRVQVYNTDGSAELYNEVEATTEFLKYYEHTVDINIRVRVMHIDGVTAYEWWTANGVITDTGFSLNISQELNKPYNDNNIDGSTVTECIIAGDKIDVNVNDPDNTLAVQRIYNWYQYYLSTEAGIRDSDNKITATDATHYTFDNNVQIINLDTVNPLNLTGANIVPVSGLATSIFDLSNGASIALNFGRVEAFSCKESLDGINDIKGTGFVKDTHSLPQCLTATGFSTHNAADVKTVMEAAGTKLTSVKDQSDRILTATEIKQCIITDASPTSLSFTTNLTEISNQFWQRAVILITSGDNEGLVRAILNYNGSTKQITLKTPLNVAPAQNDTFIILTERKYLTADIEDIIDTVFDEPMINHTISGTSGAVLSDIHDSELGKWQLDHVAKTLTYYKVDGSVLQVFDLPTTTDSVPIFIGRTPQ